MKALVIKSVDFSDVSVKQIIIRGLVNSWYFTTGDGDSVTPKTASWWYLDGDARSQIRGKIISKVKINAATAGNINIRKVVFSDTTTHLMSSSEVVATINVQPGIHEYDVNVSIGNNESIGFENVVGEGATFRYYQKTSGQAFSLDSNPKDEVQMPDMNLNISLFAKDNVLNYTNN